MTRLLEQALSRLQQLPDADQDAIAALILEEIEDERRWDETFAASQEQLEGLARKARDDARQGKVRDAGFDEL